MKELHAILTRLTPEELVGYQQRFGYFMDKSYRWDIWGAAYWLGGGCSDDGFLDFRSCLISLGEAMFAAILANPDYLADLVDRPDVPYMQTEGFQYVAMRVYREKTGEDRIPLPERRRRGFPRPKGRQLDHDDEKVMRRHYPRLVAKYPNMGG
jgi:hypothetical protein